MERGRMVGDGRARRKEGALRGDPSGSVFEIAIIGDLSDHELEFTERLLAVPLGGRCTLYFNSPGGSAYAAMSLASIIALRELDATAIVTGECSSAALWPFAACRRRYVAPHSVFLFHPLKWQSEEHVDLHEASEWARHFGMLESSMDEYLAAFFGIEVEQLHKWMRPARYVTGLELVESGLAELSDWMPPIGRRSSRRTRKKRQAVRSS